jgi:fumarate reductase flavoprotein subunit
MVKEKASPQTGLEAQLVIIGGGGVGLTAALVAAENGVKDILVLEKRSITGGNTSRARGLFGAETHLQRQEMIDISKDDYFKRAVEWNHYKVNVSLLRNWINRSNDSVRWLSDKGVQFVLGTKNRMHFNQLPAWHVAKDGTFTNVTKLLTEKCKELGIQFLVNTSGKKILRDRKGNISAVLASNGRKTLEIKTKSVVIATGGFTGNQKMLKKYFPFYDDITFSTTCLNTNKGDGVGLALSAGGTLEDSATLCRENCYSGRGFPSLPKGATAPPAFSGPMRAGLNDPIREPYVVWVNKLGQRFVEEASGFALQTSTNILLRQPGKTAYALLDDDIVQIMVDSGFMMGKRDETRGFPVPEFRKELQEDAKNIKEWIKISKSWDEIAKFIECKPDALKATIDEYNSFCEHNYDAAFLKDRRYLIPLRKPPFYAIKIRFQIYDAIGPIKINQNMEVLDKQFTPVPGLYAGGAAAGGWQSDDYCGDVLFGGNLSFAITSGMIAGENVAKFLKGQ